MLFGKIYPYPPKHTPKNYATITKQTAQTALCITNATRSSCQYHTYYTKAYRTISQKGILYIYITIYYTIYTI